MPEFAPDQRKYWTRMAPLYDDATAAEGWAVNDLIGEAAEAYGIPHSINDALDLGAGTGQTVGAILDHTHPSYVETVDIAPLMLRSLKEKFPGPNVGVVPASIEAYVATCEQKFDLVTALGSLEFVQGLPEVLGKVAGLLTIDGTLLFTYIPRTSGMPETETFQISSFQTAFSEYYWEPNTIEDTLHDSGLRILGGKNFTAYTRGAKEPQPVTYNFVAARKME
jgi:predicted TPR repeat methyltransferase